MAARTQADVNARIEAAVGRVEAAAAESTAATRRDLLEAVEALRSELRTIERRLQPPQAEAVATLAAEKLEATRPWLDGLHVPDLVVSPPLGEGPFMAWSTPSASDVRHRAFAAVCREMSWGVTFHRKLWEWVCIVHHLRRLGCLRPGQRGLGFGVGQEPLPSFFARLGVQVTATEAPPEIGIAAGWAESNEYGASLEVIRNHVIVDAETFARLVRLQTCDMNALDPALTGYDFCWSSCSLEHLGSLQAGMDFVVNSVERCLRPGGVAVHTTELNLSSDEDTVAEGPTVLYRRRDLLQLAARLRALGHHVDELRVAPDVDPLDTHVDLPPFRQNPHLKLRLLGYTTTSVAIVVRRGGRPGDRAGFASGRAME